MRRVAPIALVCCLTACAGATGPLPARGAAPAPASLAWLAGSWRAPGADTVTTEGWAQLDDGSLRGFGRTFTGSGETVHHELLRVERRGGAWVYAAAPAGQDRAAFDLVRANDREAVFENRGHDFPKRIAYVRDGDELTATVSGDPDQRSASWTFERAGEAPSAAERTVRLCRAEDGALSASVAGAGCELFCRARGDAPADLDVAVVRRADDACEAATAPCGEDAPLAIAPGACVERRAIVLAAPPG